MLPLFTQRRPITVNAHTEGTSISDESVENVTLRRCGEGESSGTYTGRMVQGLRDGAGKYTWDTGDNYDGQWREGKKDGRGVYSWFAEGSKYDGEWCQDKRDGWGVETYADGRRYDGLWRDGHRKSGMLTYADGSVYNGEWLWDAVKGEDLRHGWGVMRRKQTGVHATVTEYEGQWRRGVMHGYGTYTSPTKGWVYVGQFAYGQKSGKGQKLYEYGGSYTGSWKEGKMSGKGTRVWTSGTKYEGEWEAGREHGSGTKTWHHDGSSFRGQWVTGNMSYGTRTWPNGDEFVGDFTEGRGTLGGTVLGGTGEGTATLGGEKLFGVLQNSDFKGTGGAFHHMGQSSYLSHKELRELKDKLTQEKEAKVQLQEKLDAAQQEANQIKQVIEQKESQTEGEVLKFSGAGPALAELNSVYNLATSVKEQLNSIAEEVKLHEDSLEQLKQSLKPAKERTAELEKHLLCMTKLKDALMKERTQSEMRCDELLGKSLTVNSSKLEIQQASSHILTLTQTFMRTKPQESSITSASPDGNSEMVKPIHVDHQCGSIFTAPPFSLREVRDTLSSLRQITLKECTNLLEKYETLSKEYSDECSRGDSLQKELDDAVCSHNQLKAECKQKRMLQGALSGDASFMICPEVHSELSSALPVAQQALTMLVLTSSSQSLSSSCLFDPPSPSAASAIGCPLALSSLGTQASSGIASDTIQCIVCDERPRNVRLHPCGHGVLCFECASVVKKCPFCRSPIHERQNLFL
ncbi:2-isopropylmalate synthase [Pelomyxa schiedti]|nr:2-isopropylmalate synthase [Pelomyxa schiedti]